MPWQLLIYILFLTKEYVIIFFSRIIHQLTFSCLLPIIYLFLSYIDSEFFFLQWQRIPRLMNKEISQSLSWLLTLWQQVKNKSNCHVYAYIIFTNWLTLYFGKRSNKRQRRRRRRRKSLYISSFILHLALWSHLINDLHFVLVFSRYFFSEIYI